MRGPLRCLFSLPLSGGLEEAVERYCFVRNVDVVFSALGWEIAAETQRVLIN